MNPLFHCLLFAIAFALIPSGINAALKDDLEEVSGRTAPSLHEVQWFNRSGEFAKSLEGKVLLVNFWATWCPPCIEELPSIQNAHEFFDQNDFEVIAVNTGETADMIEQFLPALPMTIKVPIALDERLAVYAAWRVSPLPTTFLVDRSGRIRYQAIGGRNFASGNIRSIIQNLIDE